VNRQFSKEEVQVCEEILHISGPKGNAIKTTLRFHLTLVRMTVNNTKMMQM
jgi:hypothetical protein